MAVGDVYKLATIVRRSGGIRMAVNNHYFRQTNALVLDTPEEDLFDRWNTEAQDLYRGTFTSQLQLETVRISSGPPFLESFVSDDIGTAGTRTGDAMPAQMSGLLAYRTATLGRRGRGRIFLPVASEADNASTGIPISAYRNAVEAYGQALLAMNGASVTWASWEWGLWSNADQVFRPITTIQVPANWGTQRDRKHLLI